METEKINKEKIDFLNEDIMRLKEQNTQNMNDLLAKYASLENSNEKKITKFDDQVKK